MVAMSSNVGGMGAHWTCACPRPGGRERITFLPDLDELLTEGERLLGVTTSAFDGAPFSELVRERLAAVAEALGGTHRVPMTVAPTPETLEALGTTAAGQLVLDELVDHLAGRQVVGGPYVHLDLGGMLRAGLAGELDAQFRQGAAALESRLQPVRADGRTWLFAAGVTAGIDGALQLAAALRGDDAAIGPDDLLADALRSGEIRHGLAFRDRHRLRGDAPPHLSASGSVMQGRAARHVQT